MSNAKPGGFDGKLVMAIGLTVLMWIAYQSYLQKKYPDTFKTKAVSTGTTSTEKGTTESLPNSNETVAGIESKTTESGIDSKEEYLEVEDDNWRLRFSSKGMSLQSIILKKYSDREGKEIEFLSGIENKNFETNLVGRRAALDFKISKTQDNQATGISVVGGMTITKVMNLDSSTFSIGTLISVDNADVNFSGLVTKVVAPILPTKGGSFFNPAVEQQEYYISADGSDERVVLAQDKESKDNFEKVSVAALASHYFALGIVDSSDTLPEFQAASLVQKVPAGGVVSEALGTMIHTKLSKDPTFAVKYKAYAGPKSWKALEGVDKDLTSMINFGFFKTIAIWIFKLLVSIHAAVGNWGLAIILLTILVRVLVLPFNIISYRSMKAMTKIQPEIKSVRDKYKNDPAKANQEIMKIMKESKANPLGGCLPIFLQIPVFFALYQVLGQSIELYKAPFFFWINDLSQHDKFFVFPVLMGITMFIQQKITPSTLEPAQQKILLFMPIFLTVLMAGLPSGLTLYMFVSTLFGVTQQIYFMKDDKKREALA